MRTVKGTSYDTKQQSREVLGIGVATRWGNATEVPPGATSIPVLYFESLPPDTADSRMADGFTEEVHRAARAARGHEPGLCSRQSDTPARYLT